MFATEKYKKLSHRTELFVLARRFFALVTHIVIALFAGLAILAIVFANGLALAAGPGLLLQTLPIAFSKMPLGHVMAVLFFLLVVFAAWTSAISLLEPCVVLITERFGTRRSVTAWVAGAGVWLLGIAVSLSFNKWSDFKIAGPGLFDLLDKPTTNIMMPLGGLLVAVFVGWVMRKEHVADEAGMSSLGLRVFYLVLRYVSPIAIALIFLHVAGWLG